VDVTAVLLHTFIIYTQATMSEAGSIFWSRRSVRAKTPNHWSENWRYSV